MNTNYCDIESILGVSVEELSAGGAVFAEPQGDLHLFQGEPSFMATPVGNFPLLYINDFNLEGQTPFVSFPKYKRIARADLDRICPTRSNFKINWNEPQQSDFEVVFNKIKGDLGSGLQKTVPVVFAHSEQNVSLVHLLSSAISNRKDRWLYGFWNKSRGFIGVTPELLFKRRNKFLKSMALAGTSKIEEQLIDAKNNREHQLVVDEIKRRLETVGEVVVSETHELVVGSIKHLRAHLDCKLRANISCSELVELMHPTPALGSLPRLANRSDQVRYDSEDRGPFGAPFGFIENDGAEVFIVSIRCVDWEGGQMRLGSGCGVILESNLENEWRELKSKRESVREIFNI